MFAQRLAGHSAVRITRALNDAAACGAEARICAHCAAAHRIWQCQLNAVTATHHRRFPLG
jgi:hypothetical protein